MQVLSEGCPFSLFRGSLSSERKFEAQQPAFSVMGSAQKVAFSLKLCYNK